MSSDNTLPVAGTAASWGTYLVAQATPQLTPSATWAAVFIAFFTFGIGVSRAAEAYFQWREKRLEHEERMSGVHKPLGLPELPEPTSDYTPSQGAKL